MSFVTINDPGDARLDDYRNIPDGELVARRGIFVAEGRLVVSRLLTESPLATRSVMVTEAARASLADVFAARPEVPVYVVPQSVVDDVAGLHIHRGCLAIGVRPAAHVWQHLVGATHPPSLKLRRTSALSVVIILERVANAD